MELKPRHTVIVFVIFLTCSVWASINSYNITRRNIVNDMNQALALTLSEKCKAWITPDTIQDYRGHLKIAEIRNYSYVSYAMKHDDKGLYSSKMVWQSNARTLEFQSFVNCSMASVFSMSDQRVSFLFCLLSLLWLSGSMAYFRKRRKDMIVLGRLMMSNSDRNFYDLKRRAIRFSPMQTRLMEMFFTSPGHYLSKQQICDMLWPKKPDASETLYALISRLKPLAEELGGLEIVSERGKYYQLKTKS